MLNIIIIILLKISYIFLHKNVNHLNTSPNSLRERFFTLFQYLPYLTLLYLFVRIKKIKNKGKEKKRRTQFW